MEILSKDSVQLKVNRNEKTKTIVLKFRKLYN